MCRYYLAFFPDCINKKPKQCTSTELIRKCEWKAEPTNAGTPCPIPRCSWEEVTRIGKCHKHGGEGETGISGIKQISDKQAQDLDPEQLQGRVG
jgi:hypothetical protein